MTHAQIGLDGHAGIQVTAPDGCAVEAGMFHEAAVGVAQIVCDAQTAAYLLLVLQQFTVLSLRHRASQQEHV